LESALKLVCESLTAAAARKSSFLVQLFDSADDQYFDLERLKLHAASNYLGKSRS
jgi:hypothetical protein